MVTTTDPRRDRGGVVRVFENGVRWVYEEVKKGSAGASGQRSGMGSTRGLREGPEGVSGVVKTGFKDGLNQGVKRGQREGQEGTKRGSRAVQEHACGEMTTREFLSSPTPHEGS